MRLALVMLLFSAKAAMALAPEAPLPQPAQEMRAKALFQELRCVVCQGESVADSPAQVAEAVRAHVRDSIRAGKSDEEILAEMVRQYGEDVLMTPPFARHTALLWLAPLMMLGMAGWLARWYFRQAREV